ncbi:hypothetical protein ZWY2020_059055 [Hordeum vulgare]|nr:hypothetical protein ZWY2020_059055 [Hordeum vulgare]
MRGESDEGGGNKRKLAWLGEIEERLSIKKQQEAPTGSRSSTGARGWGRGGVYHPPRHVPSAHSKEPKASEEGAEEESVQEESSHLRDDESNDDEDEGKYVVEDVANNMQWSEHWDKPVWLCDVSKLPHRPYEDKGSLVEPKDFFTYLPVMEDEGNEVVEEIAKKIVFNMDYEAHVDVVVKYFANKRKMLIPISVAWRVHLTCSMYLKEVDGALASAPSTSAGHPSFHHAGIARPLLRLHNCPLSLELLLLSEAYSPPMCRQPPPVAMAPDVPPSMEPGHHQPEAKKEEEKEPHAPNGKVETKKLPKHVWEMQEALAKREAEGDNSLDESEVPVADGAALEIKKRAKYDSKKKEAQKKTSQTRKVGVEQQQGVNEANIDEEVYVIVDQESQSLVVESEMTTEPDQEVEEAKQEEEEEDEDD